MPFFDIPSKHLASCQKCKKYCEDIAFNKFELELTVDVMLDKMLKGAIIYPYIS